ncbi:hypothetical protein GIB67_034025 [Kingdonia uniflora]|uniref:rRNA methyltransferase 2, mitochondrial n=1 Tax=Kingdonia uniflora TaxID=39325 RepID=A0A7J7M631_9MAGN|nr:hypothetical protein GIB67_034025 [Kingdonia uniflora]
MSGISPDFYYREAQRLKYLARSAFKLLQMQKQYKLITPGASVLDLGCAPGAWLQVACQSLGSLQNGGAVVGIDLKCKSHQCWVAEQKVKVPSDHCDHRVQTVCADVMKIPIGVARALSPQIASGLGREEPSANEIEKTRELFKRGVRRSNESVDSSAKSSIVKNRQKFGVRSNKSTTNPGLRQIVNSNLVVNQYRFHTIDWDKPPIFDESPEEGIGFSVILSDMCPLVSGIAIKDAALSIELGMRALDLALGGTTSALSNDHSIHVKKPSNTYSYLEDDRGVLLPGGNLVIKLLESEDIKEISQICKPLFGTASWLRPKATRSASREIYLICKNLK